MKASAPFPRRPLAVCASIVLVLAASASWAQNSSRTDTKARAEAAARMAAEFEKELVASQAAAAKREQTAKEEAERRARVAAALAAPIVPIVPTTEAARGAGGTAVAGSIAAPALAGATAPAAQLAAQPLMPAAPEQKLALLIGNSSYKVGPLTNPVNDVRAMAIKLQQLGFTVIKKENASRADMMDAVRDFGTQLQNGGIGVFYYAGHGIQSKGQNFLVPVDSDIRSEDELATRAYNAAEVLEKMDTAKNRINMVILDACRDNPFARSFRSGGRGLAGIDHSPRGTLVAYATSPGSTASDGVGANGLYTEQLLRAMSEPGLELGEVFKRTSANVLELSEGKQMPWLMSSVTGDFYFNPTPEQQAKIDAQRASATVALAGGGGGGGGAIAREQQRTFMPVLISRKLIEHYQLTGNFPLNGQPSVAAFTQNGDFFALASKDRTLKTWNTMTGMPVATETSYVDGTLAVGRKAMIGLAENGRVAVHDLKAEVVRRNTDKLPTGAQVAALSPNGKRLLIHTQQKGFMLFDADTQTMVAQLDSVEGAPRFLFSPNSDRLVTWGERDSTMKLWEADSGKRITRMSDHWNAVGMARFSNDGSTLVTAAHDDKAVVWRMSDGDSLRKLEFGEGNPLPKEAELFNNGKHFMAWVARTTKVPGAPLQLGVWETNTGRQVATLLPDGAQLQSYKLAQAQNRLFINGSDRNLYVYDLATLQRSSVMSGVEFIDMSPDGRRFLVRNNDGVRLMDTSSMAPIGRMPGQVNAFSSRRGNLFATSGSDGSVTLWNFDNGDQVGILKGHLDTVTGVVFADDGRRLVSLGSDNTGRLWALPEIKDMHQLTKDQFESTAEYNKRMTNWSSPYTSLVTLAGYNADAETFNIRFGDITAAVPLDRESAKKLVGQRQAIITAKLRFFDGEQLILADTKLTRLP